MTIVKEHFYVFATVLTLLLTGCELKQKILDVNAVSMTKDYLKEGESLKETGPVKSTFCADSIHDRGPIGILDRLIQTAQEADSADYLTNVSFYRTGKSCFLLEGTGNTIVAAAAKPSEMLPHTKTKKH